MIEKTLLQLVEDELGYVLTKDDAVRREIESAVREFSPDDLENEASAVCSICDATPDRDGVEVRLAVAQVLARDAARILVHRVAKKLGLSVPAPVYGGNPSTWPVQLSRSDEDGTSIDPRRLVYVWGYAAAGLDWGEGCLESDPPRVLRLHDDGERLVVSWSKTPGASAMDALRYAWTRAGGEGASLVEHWVDDVCLCVQEEEERDEI